MKADVDGLASTDAQIVAALDVGESTVQRLRLRLRLSRWGRGVPCVASVCRHRQRLVEHGFEAALERQPPARTKSRRLEGVGEARGVAVARRSRRPRSQELQPRLQRQWVVPPDGNAEFVCAREDTLNIDHRPHDPRRLYLARP